jgi:hypothetical protein
LKRQEALPLVFKEARRARGLVLGRFVMPEAALK